MVAWRGGCKAFEQKLKNYRHLHLALVKIGVPWHTALEMSETEAGAYLDAFAQLNGLKKKRDSGVSQQRYLSKRQPPKTHP